MKTLTLPLILLLLSLPLEPAPAAETDWNLLDSPPFKIHYLDSDLVYTREIASLFDIAYKDFVSKLGLRVAEPVNVFVCPTDKLFNKLTGNFIPHWGEGVANPVKSLIILKSPSLTDNHKRLPKLVRHELAHIMIGQAATHPESLPKWFNEGMAIYLSADEEFTPGTAISKALMSDSIIPLDEIDRVLRFQQAKARLAYEESYSFTLFLIENYGFASVTDLLHYLNAGLPFEQAFQRAFGADLFDMELQWYAYLEDEYRWSFLMDFEFYLWIFILILFIFVFIAIRWRNHRTLKRWEEEERLANW